MTLEHKQKVPFTMVDSDTTVCGEPNAAGGHEQINMDEEERVKKAVQSITILTEES